MKRTVLTALAMMFAAAPVMTSFEASAQSRGEIRRELREERRDIRDDRRDVRELRRELRRDRRQASRPSWLRQGGRYRDGGVIVRDYRRYGLRAPGRGRQWVRVNNDYVLVSIVGGLIGAIISSR